MDVNGMANKENPMALPEGYILQERYQIQKILGSGGFGITYKAMDLLNQSVCAVKEYVPMGICTRLENGITLQSWSQESDRRFAHGKMRFLEEAQLLLEVSNVPNIVRVLDFFEDNETAYYVMEYLDGVSIKDFRNRYFEKKIPFPIAYEIIAVVGQSLDRVHFRCRLLHRDISPDNIVLTKNGIVKLIDFGTAKHICKNGDQSFTVSYKPGFTPPEQYRSNCPQGPYTDVYALAGTLYFMICGKMLPESMERIAGTTYTPAHELAPGVTRQISAVLDKAINTDYKKRYQTVEAFLEELKQAKKTAEEAPGFTQDHKETIYVYEKEQLLFEYQMSADEMIGVGRIREGNAIVLPGKREVSRYHCYIEYNSSEQCFFVKNISTNGTFYKGKLLEKERVYPIRKGDTITLATNAYTLQLGERTE